VEIAERITVPAVLRREGAMNMHWPFDQKPNVAAITTRQILEDGYPILRVVHYSDDHSWAFTCGTTNKVKDGRVICMKEVLELDPTISEIADLPTGWGASREVVGGEWQRYPGKDF
jgi:hypothetical protein